MAIRLREQHIGFLEWLGFQKHDWREAWKATVRLMGYITRYSGTSVHEMLDWDVDLLIDVWDEIGEIVVAENKSGNPSF